MSYKIAFNFKGVQLKTKARYYWPKEYAAIAHEGATLRNGTVLPPRRWTETALAGMDFSQVVAVLFKRNGGDIDRAFRDACLILGRKFTEEITAAKWDWPQGESPRDIVDTGDLRSAQVLEFI